LCSFEFGLKEFFEAAEFEGCPDFGSHGPALEWTESPAKSLLHPFGELYWLTMSPEEMAAIAESDSVLQVPSD